jgi:hypothetical protein
MSYYCTSFCNQGHSFVTGKPLDHECYVLPPKALRMEFLGNVELACEYIQAAKPLPVHGGTRCRHRWAEQTTWSLSGEVLAVDTACTACGRAKEKT